MGHSTGARLLRLLVQRSPVSDRRVMAHSAAFLYGSGATLVMVTILASRAPGTILVPIVAVIVVAYAVTIGLLLGRDRIPTGLYPYLVALGTVLITILVYSDGAPASAYSLLYVWAALYSFYFFAPALAVAEVVLIAATSGFELYLREAGNGAGSRWLLIVGTSLAAGAVMQQLVNQVRAMADHDGLTGLANRRRMDAELDREMTRATRSHGDVCVVLLDLDHFKLFNDEMGHVEGDKHLRKTSTHWRQELREGDLLARYGGEEFAAVLPDCTLVDACRTADRLRSVVPHGQTVSAGVAQWDGEESRAALLGRADAALYEAKVAGRDRIVQAAEKSLGDGDSRAPQSWAKMLPAVLDERSIRFGYQPIVRLSDRAVMAYEALARPQGMAIDLSVEGFFAAAQRLGYGRDLDWLCRRLCLQNSREVIPSGTLFMNIGVPALLAPVHGVDQMLLLLEWSGWSASDIVLEITERELISDLDRFQEVLALYREAGFRFAIDDLGDGHSTLEVLAAGTPEFVKIARRLTASASQPGARAAVRAVTAYAASLGSLVIAEGIEDEYQAKLMEELGCQMGQGYALGRPAWPTIAAPNTEAPRTPELRVLSR